MRNIIDHVRNFARGNDDIMLSNFNVVEPINNALSLFTEQLKNRGINVTKDFSDEISSAVVHGNTYKIEQVLLNLFSNARDTMDDKILSGETDYEPTLLIGAKTEDSNLVLTVADNGMGMNEHQLKQITKPFVTTKAPGKGTGLGLAISQKIIAEHQGTISFSSVPSEGTTVKIVLPLSVKVKPQSATA